MHKINFIKPGTPKLCYVHKVICGSNFDYMDVSILLTLFSYGIFVCYDSMSSGKKIMASQITLKLYNWEAVSK